METKVRPPGMLKATVIRRLADTAVAWGRLEGKPSFRFGLSTVRFGLTSVTVIAAGMALLTWLPNKEVVFTVLPNSFLERIKDLSPTHHSPWRLAIKAFVGVLELPYAA